MTPGLSWWQLSLFLPWYHIQAFWSCLFFPSLSKIKSDLTSGKSVEGCFPKCQVWGSVDQKKLGWFSVLFCWFRGFGERVLVCIYFKWLRIYCVIALRQQLMKDLFKSQSLQGLLAACKHWLLHSPKVGAPPSARRNLPDSSSLPLETLSCLCVVFIF